MSWRPHSSGEFGIRECDLAAARALSSECGVGVSAAQVLLHRGLADPSEAREHVEARLAGMSSPDTMADREAACERIARACRKGERVSIFGDYDVDGTTSAAILADVLTMLGAEVSAFVANRFQGGYGFSEQALDRCLSVKPGLIVTCDCGSSDHPRIARAKAAGVDVIVVDHHLVPDEPLPALAFLNPHRPDCGFAYKGMCSAGLALSVAAGVRSALGVKLDVRQWLDLVALGTVADIAPLTGDNRRLTRAGLQLLGSPNVRPGIAALRDAAWLKPGIPLSAREIAFRIAPRLNAPGRLGDPTIVLELLRERDRGRARELAAKIEHINAERKEVERHATEEAMAQVEAIYGAHPETGVVVAGHGWHRGVVGITAARLVDRFQVPAVVIGLDEEDGVVLGHGSGRTIKGFDLHAALSACEDTMTRFGGHAAACGMTIEGRRVDELRASFADSTRGAEPLEPMPIADVVLGGDFPIPSVDDLMKLEPLGEQNPDPLFAAIDVEVLDGRVVGQGHLKLSLKVDGSPLSAFGWDRGDDLQRLGPTVSVLGRVRRDRFAGGGRVELELAHLADLLVDEPVLVRPATPSREQTL